MGFLGLLTLIFVLAKLFGAIAWSWWLVFLPAIIGFGFNLVIVAVAALITIFEK